MRHPKELTRIDIIRAASRMRWHRKMPKWTAVIEGRELPARPLVLEAAGVAPNDPTNSHQAVDILRRLGFETRYSREPSATAAGGEPVEGIEPLEEGEPGLNSILDIASAARQEVPENAWERIPSDFSKNVDHYLYGTKKTEE